MKVTGKNCIICNNASYPVVHRGDIDYFLCSSCNTLFCDTLDNSNLIGGEFEKERNEKENVLRIDRINEMAKGARKEEINILDFGCGHGMLIEDLKKAGYENTWGFDAYYEPFQKLPERNKYQLVTAVEVFEHFSPPFYEIDVIHRSLVNGGVVMVETSFTDVAQQEGIPLQDFFYVNPLAGHSTIFSHHGLDVLMVMRGFIPQQGYNRHVKIYAKVLPK